MEDEKILICVECVDDIRLKMLIESIGKQGLCSCCDNSNYIIDVDSNEFIQMIKALIRYHFSEWDYNRHWGGDGHEFLLYEFFNSEKFTKIGIDDLIIKIECFKVYEEYEKGVSIFAGNYRREHNPPLRSIKSDLDPSIKKIEKSLEYENYFNFENEITEILTKYVFITKLTIEKGKVFYRARIGYKDKKRDYLAGFDGEEIFVPYSNSEIGAPPPHSSGFGRINRAGVSFLYCATDKYTAISEVRPHPGDIVSVGKFVLNKDLLIYDLTEILFLNFYKSDKELDEFKPLNTFTELMQKVIPPSERQSYSITQLIADCIRQLNFDGILFPSSVGDGQNLVVFNPVNMSYTFDNAEVVEVNRVEYNYSQRKWKKDIS
jgi:RES domain-containing protein